MKISKKILSRERWKRDGTYPTKLFNFTLLSTEALHARYTSEILFKSNNNLNFTLSERGVKWWDERIPYEVLQSDNIITLSLTYLAYV